jgi:glycosyltransferase involved in cell wall biosynthesis
MGKIELSIIIPTYNRQKRLARVMAALEVQTYPLKDIEVIVVSDGSTDRTNQFLKEYRPSYNLQPIFQANQGVAVARNTGVMHARADWILFLDDDVCPAPELVGEHIAWQKKREKAVILGPMLTPPNTRLLPWVMWEQLMLEKQYKNMQNGEWEPTARQFYTGNTSLEKRYIQEAGNFDPAFTRAEDVELAYRLKDIGLQFIFNPKAIGYHFAERSFNAWLDIAYTYGKNDVMMSEQKQQHWLLPQIRVEYHGRNILTRELTRMCLDRMTLQRGYIALLKGLALSADQLHLDVLARYCFSGIYNLRYYQGIADMLGGRESFYLYMDDLQIPTAQNRGHK